MKKLLVSILVTLLLFSNAYAIDQWRNGTGANTILGTASPSDIDTISYSNIVAPLDNLLAEGKFDCVLSYASASTVTVAKGSVVVSNAAGTIRLMTRNAASTTVSWANLDAGGEANSTTYYIYAYATAVADTTFLCKISTNATTPTGLTYYKKIGSFYNDASGNITNIQSEGYSAKPILGTWVAKSVNTSYQASTDGFVVARHNHSAGGAHEIYINGYTDAANPPTTLVAQSLDSQGYANEIVLCITFPVKSGDYYKVTSGQSLTYTDSTTIYWIPLQ